ncbi:MAG: LamG-like jellyroll fold domain-containing protein [Candidatus Micrarchaeaceae archaeon]
MQKTGGSVLKRSRIFKSGINRRAMKAARESIALLLTEEKQGKADYSSNYLVRKIFIDKHNQKFQSAMEYLMTYGWAILIIAVVLGALYSLGVFNSNNFAPKAPPGSCQVFRPNGPGTTSFINLEGVCNGELPEYVASFNGQSSIIAISSIPTTPQSSITIAGWVYISGFTSSNGDQEWWTDSASSSSIGLQSYPNTFPGATSTDLVFFLHNATNAGYGGCNLPANLNTWYFVAEQVNGNVATLYVNGMPVSGCTFNYPNPGTETYITIGGYTPSSTGAGNIMDGFIANLQIYNTSLSSNEIQAIYAEGIGGAPIDLQNLVGWWPLNGNANDYSGNGNNGVPSNVMFVSNWYSGYTPP